jgi:hypothetical protein
LGQPGSQGALGSIYNTGGNSWSQGVVGCSGGIFGGGGGGNWGNGISSPGSPGFVTIPENPYKTRRARTGYTISPVTTTPSTKNAS